MEEQTVHFPVLSSCLTHVVTLTIWRMGRFLARVCMPNQWPRFFKIALSEKLLLVLSACRITYMYPVPNHELSRFTVT